MGDLTVVELIFYNHLRDLKKHDTQWHSTESRMRLRLFSGLFKKQRALNNIIASDYYKLRDSTEQEEKVIVENTRNMMRMIYVSSSENTLWVTTDYEVKDGSREENDEEIKMSRYDMEDSTDYLNDEIKSLTREFKHTKEPETVHELRYEIRKLKNSRFDVVRDLKAHENFDQRLAYFERLFPLESLSLELEPWDYEKEFPLKHLSLKTAPWNRELRFPLEYHETAPWIHETIPWHLASERSDW
jgi:hypothetical protein